MKAKLQYSPFLFDTKVDVWLLPHKNLKHKNVFAHYPY